MQQKYLRYCLDAPEEEKQYEIVVSMLPLSPDEKVRMVPRILEVGCCESNFCEILALAGYDVLGVDIRDPVFGWAMSAKKDLSHVRFGPLQPKFNFLRADFTTYSTRDIGHFDVGVDLSSVEHFGCEFYGEPFSRYGDFVSWAKMAGICDVVYSSCTIHTGLTFVNTSSTRIYNDADWAHFWSAIGDVAVLDEQCYDDKNGVLIQCKVKR